jgi:hypothetical protein
MKNSHIEIMKAVCGSFKSQKAAIAVERSRSKSLSFIVGMYSGDNFEEYSKMICSASLNSIVEIVEKLSKDKKFLPLD